MPTYEYRCPEGHEFEQFVRSIREGAAELPCPVCGKVAVRKVSGGAGLVFKGSGFYITDYGKDGKKDLRRAAGKPSSSEGGEGKSRDTDKPSTTAGDAGDAGAAKPNAEKGESKGTGKKADE
jgi:putative FmdB family regulatory protein